MTALALATVLTFVAPAHKAVPGTCSPDTTRPSRCASVLVQRHRQSPTWIAHAASFRSWYDAGHRDWPDSLAALWPQIRAEAEWQYAQTVPCAAGQACSTSVDSGWWYRVAARDSANNTSCWSNEVSR